jgi:acyl dehydratase
MRRIIMSTDALSGTDRSRERSWPARLPPTRFLRAVRYVKAPTSSARKATDGLYLDDLHFGQRFTSGTHVVDEEQIKAFARQFDPQPFHLDNEAAKNTLLSGLAASGWHTAAVTMRLLDEGGLPFASGIVGAGGELNWPNPARPGDTLQVESEVSLVIQVRSRGCHCAKRDAQSEERDSAAPDGKVDRPASRMINEGFDTLTVIACQYLRPAVNCSQQNQSLTIATAKPKRFQERLVLTSQCRLNTWEPHVAGLALPKSVDTGNFGLN